jgi:glycosyltransferase involved in cell wall biosynthesis
LNKLAVFVDWYTPAYKAGGPISSCVNLVRLLLDTFKIYIITSNEDLNSEYLDVETDIWIKLHRNVDIIYLSKPKRSFRSIAQIIKDIKVDVIYCNSMFSKSFSIYPMLFGCFWNKNKVVLSPRGMLKSSALSIKESKKKIFLTLFRLFGIHNKLVFQANTDEEANQIKFVFGNDITCLVVPNVPAAPIGKLNYLEKENRLNFLFLGRIHPIKGLDLLVKFLEHFNTQIKLTIAGTIENQEYWQSVEENLKEKKIDYAILGSLPPTRIPKIIQQNHFLTLPTYGENFGHAIFEAFAAGRPVLISDQTPWRDLEEKKIGFDIALEEKDEWLGALERITKMDQAEYNQWCQNALDFAHDFIEESNLKDRYLKLFS